MDTLSTPVVLQRSIQNILFHSFKQSRVQAKRFRTVLQLKPNLKDGWSQEVKLPWNFRLEPGGNQWTLVTKIQQSPRTKETKNQQTGEKKQLFTNWPKGNVNQKT